MTTKTAKEIESEMPETMRAALTEVFGSLLADAKAHWAAELEVLRAERRALIAELQHDLSEFKLAALTTKAGK
jgi:hypothetical protein